MTKPLTKKSDLRNHARVIIPGVTVTVGALSIPWNSPQRPEVIAAIKAEKWDDVQKLMSPLKNVTAYGKGNFKISVKDNAVTYKGKPVDTLLNKRIIEMANQKLPIEYLLKFIDWTRKNPDESAQRQLYSFLEYGKLPITQTGTFLARKVVARNFKDKHTGTLDYSAGKVVKMDRKDVNPNPNQTCAAGLHVYSVEYARYFWGEGDHYMLVEINPKDVCAVPTDYKETKMRVCAMKVIEELKVEDDPVFFGGLTTTMKHMEEAWY